MSWEKEYREICEVINQTPESRMKKDWLKKDIKKTLKKVGHLDYNLFPLDFRWNLCAARLRMGRFDNWDGWEFRSDWAITFHGLNGYKFDIPKWRGQECEKLIICGEQGVGDEILFASALPELIVRLGRPCLEYQTYPRLISLMERSFGIKCVPRQKLGELKPQNDTYVVALADLLMFYRRDASHFPRRPFLKPDPVLVDKFKSRLDALSDKPKIGIGWKARHGSLDPKELMVEDATYINLQYLAHPDGDWVEPLPEGIIDLGVDPTEDMEAHIALIAALDKVVTVTQTTVHEAGAIGKECHAIRPKKGTGEVNNMLWYYSQGSVDSPIYSSVHIWNTPKDYQNHQERLRRDNRTRTTQTIS